MTLSLVFMGYAESVGTVALSASGVSTAGVLSTGAVADLAEGWARRVKELEELGDDPLQRSGMRLLATQDYDVWLLRWPHCTRVSPHDHGGSVGAFAVIWGTLMELRWDDSVPKSRSVGRGDVVTVDHGVVHDVVAIHGPAYSVHVYSPPLTEMSFYDEFGVEVTRQVAVEDDDSSLRRVQAWS